MDHGDWSRLKEPWDRLRWARLRWQADKGATTASAAAESLGMKPDTYSAYEREPGASKHTALDHQRAAQFGKKFQCNWVWLLTGEESPFARTPAQNRVLAAMSAKPDTEQEFIASMVEAMPKRSGTEG